MVRITGNRKMSLRLLVDRIPDWTSSHMYNVTTANWMTHFTLKRLLK